MEIINLTPHPITIIEGDVTITFPVSGSIARVASTTVEDTSIAGIKVVKTILGEVSLGIEIEADTIYIVSAMVLNTMKMNGHCVEQFVAPNTGAAIRDKEGHIVGVPGFTR